MSHPDEIKRINFYAQCQGRKMHDDWDAYMVQTLRELGRKIGQPKVYEKRIRKYLKERGY